MANVLQSKLTPMTKSHLLTCFFLALLRLQYLFNSVDLYQILLINFSEKLSLHYVYLCQVQLILSTQNSHSSFIFCMWAGVFPNFVCEY